MSKLRWWSQLSTAGTPEWKTQLYTMNQHLSLHLPISVIPMPYSPHSHSPQLSHPLLLLLVWQPVELNHLIRLGVLISNSWLVPLENTDFNPKSLYVQMHWIKYMERVYSYAIQAKSNKQKVLATNKKVNVYIVLKMTNVIICESKPFNIK